MSGVYRHYPHPQPVRPGIAVFAEAVPPPVFPVELFRRTHRPEVRPDLAVPPLRAFLTLGEAPPAPFPVELLRGPSFLRRSVEWRSAILPRTLGALEDTVIVVVGDAVPPQVYHRRDTSIEYARRLLPTFLPPEPPAAPHIPPARRHALTPEDYRHQPARAEPIAALLATPPPPPEFPPELFRRHERPAVREALVASTLHAFFTMGEVAPPAFPVELLRRGTVAPRRDEFSQVEIRGTFVLPEVAAHVPPAARQHGYAREDFDWPQPRPMIAALLAPVPLAPAEDVRITFRAERERVVYTTAREVSVFSTASELSISKAR